MQPVFAGNNTRAPTWRRFPTAPDEAPRFSELSKAKSMPHINRKPAPTDTELDILGPLLGSLLEEVTSAPTKRMKKAPADGLMVSKQQKLLDDCAAAILASEPTGKEIGFLARAFVLATLPHSRPAADDLSFTRVNGEFTLTVEGRSECGLPYGSIPRLVLIWLCSEVTRTGEKNINLGSVPEFMARLGMKLSTGPRGTVTLFTDQMLRLINTSFAVDYDTKSGCKKDSPIDGIDTTKVEIAVPRREWWLTSNERPALPIVYQAVITVSDSFFKEVTDSAVPIDMRAVKGLHKSPLALDLYIWATHRSVTVRKRTLIPWSSFAAQFGASYLSMKLFRRNVREAAPLLRYKEPGFS